MTHLRTNTSPRLRALSLAVALASLVSGTAMAGSADLDPTYGSQGRFQFPMSDYGARVAAGTLQPDGKLLLAGWAGVGSGGVYNSSNYAITRFHAVPPPGYTLNDTTFGDGSGKSTLDHFGFSDEIVDMVRTDAGIYAIGFAYEFNTRYQVMLRFTHAGLPDPTFGTNGKRILPLYNNESLLAMAVQPDGKIVAVGQSTGEVSQKDYFIARFLPDGGLDDYTFGNGGKTPIIASFGNDVAHGVAIQPDGKILVVGESNDGGPTHTAVLRLTPWGGIDYAFGSAGFARIRNATAHLYGRKLAVTHEGLILVGSEGLLTSQTYTGINVARLDSNGAPSTSFNGTGSRFDLYAPGGLYYLGGMEVMPTGQLMVAGGLTIPNGGTATIYSARYTEGGALDTTYNNGYGYKLGDIGSIANNPTSAEFLGVAADGKVYIGGHSQGTYFSLRYQGIPVDLVPNDVELNGVMNVVPGAQIASQLFYVNGLSAGAVAPITVSNGWYSRNGQPATNQPGYVANGDSIRIVQIASSEYATQKTTVVAIGGVSPANNRGSISGPRMTTTFSTTTEQDPGGYEEF